MSTRYRLDWRILVKKDLKNGMLIKIIIHVIFSFYYVVTCYCELLWIRVRDLEQVVQSQ